MNRSDWNPPLPRIAAFVAACTLLVGPGSKPLCGEDEASIPRMAVKATLCELVAAPQRFHGSVVEIQAVVQTGSETSLLRDDTCSTFIWLSGLETSQATVSAAAIALRKDRQYQKLLQYLEKKYKPNDGSVCARCPLYRVTATVVGRFEHIPKGGSPAGFGYQNSYESQLVLLGVSNVVAETIDRTGMPKSK